MTVTGQELPPGQALQLVWRTVKGEWETANGEYHGRSFTPVGYRIATVRTGADGSFTTTFVVPEDFGFQ